MVLYLVHTQPPLVQCSSSISHCFFSCVCSSFLVFVCLFVVVFNFLLGQQTVLERLLRNHATIPRSFQFHPGPCVPWHYCTCPYQHEFSISSGDVRTKTIRWFPYIRTSGLVFNPLGLVALCCCMLLLYVCSIWTTLMSEVIFLKTAAIRRRRRRKKKKLFVACMTIALWCEKGI